MKRFSFAVPRVLVPRDEQVQHLQQVPQTRMSHRRSLLAVLITLALIPCALFAQIHPAGSPSVDGRVYVKVYVTLPNPSIRYNPMQDVPVVIYRARGGVTLPTPAIKAWDPNYGGRRNAGSNKSGGGTPITPADYAARLRAAID